MLAHWGHRYQEQKILVTSGNKGIATSNKGITTSNSKKLYTRLEAIALVGWSL